jgi:hypothetical protein
VDPTQIAPLAMEPTMHRALHYHPGAVIALRRSKAEKRLVVTDGRPQPQPMDTAGAVIVTRSDHPKAGIKHLTGFGASTGFYLRPGEPVVAPAARAVRAALKSADLEARQVARLILAGLRGIGDDEIADAAGFQPSTLVERSRPDGDLGYATGMIALIDALESEDSGPVLIVSASGLGLESAYAIVLERT